MQTIYTPYNFTVSNISSGPPASPSTGDIWVATNVDANGTRWQFQYNAGSSSAYKWEFIGGPPMRFPYHDVSAYLNTMTNSGYTMGLGYTVYLDNAILVTPGRAGEYLVRGSYTVDNNSVNANIVALQPIYSGGGAGNVWTSAYCDGSLRWGHIALADTPITIGATDHVWLGLSSSDPTSMIARWNAGGVTPVRIS